MPRKPTKSKSPAKSVTPARLTRRARVVPLSSCFAGRATRSGLLLGYGSTPTTTIADAVRRLVALA